MEMLYLGLKSRNWGGFFVLQSKFSRGVMAAGFSSRHGVGAVRFRCLAQILITLLLVQDWISFPWLSYLGIDQADGEQSADPQDEDLHGCQGGSAAVTKRTLVSKT